MRTYLLVYWWYLHVVVELSITSTGNICYSACTYLLTQHNISNDGDDNDENDKNVHRLFFANKLTHTHTLTERYALKKHICTGIEANDERAQQKLPAGNRSRICFTLKLSLFVGIFRLYDFCYESTQSEYGLALLVSRYAVYFELSLINTRILYEFQFIVMLENFCADIVN